MRHKGYYAGLEQTNAHVHIHNKALGTPVYKFHPSFHKILSSVITNFNLNGLSKEQLPLIEEYLAVPDTFPATASANEEINQLDQYLGSLLEDSDEFCNKRK